MYFNQNYKQRNKMCISTLNRMMTFRARLGFLKIRFREGFAQARQWFLWAKYAIFYKFRKKSFVFKMDNTNSVFSHMPNVFLNSGSESSIQAKCVQGWSLKYSWLEFEDILTALNLRNTLELIVSAFKVYPLYLLLSPVHQLT